jgi:hypothetical protein
MTNDEIYLEALRRIKDSSDPVLVAIFTLIADLAQNTKPPAEWEGPPE